MKNRIKFCIVMFISFMLLTGCAKGIDLSEQHNDMIAEYVAGTMLKYSYSYKYKYEDLQETFSYDEPVSSEDESQTGSEIPSETGVEETSAQAEAYWNVEKAFKIEPLKVKYVSYEITDEYPGGDSLFSFSAEKGQTFVVLNFKLCNNTAQDVAVDNSSLRPAVKLAVNNKQQIINYGNLMLNDITNLKNVTVAAGSEYDGIIVFMVSKELASYISAMKVQYDGIEYEIL